MTSRFPLKDIECRGIGNQKMNRVINSLDIEWRPFTEEWQNKNVYTQLQQAPFLNLYFLNCSVSFSTFFISGFLKIKIE